MDIIVEEIKIRNVNEEDLLLNKDTIIELLDQNYKINFPYLLDAKKFSRESYGNMLTFNKKNMAIIIGAFDKKNIIGFLWAYEKIFLCDKRYHIGHIVVNQMYRHKGIGKKLVNELECIATENNVAVIELITTPENKKTMLFYENIGFDIERVQLYKKIGVKYDN